MRTLGRNYLPINKQKSEFLKNVENESYLSPSLNKFLKPPQNYRQKSTTKRKSNHNTGSPNRSNSQLSNSPRRCSQKEESRNHNLNAKAFPMSLRIKEIYSPSIGERRQAESSYINKFHNYIHKNRKAQNTFEDRISKYSRNSSISKRSGNSGKSKSSGRNSIKRSNYKNSILFKKTKKILNGTLNAIGSNGGRSSNSKKRNISCGNLGRSNSNFRNGKASQTPLQYSKFIQKTQNHIKTKKRANSSTCKIKSRLQNVLGVDKKKFQAKVFSPLICKNGTNEYFSSRVFDSADEKKKAHTFRGINSIFKNENNLNNLKILNGKSKPINISDLYKGKGRKSSRNSASNYLRARNHITPDITKAKLLRATNISTANTQNYSSKSSKKSLTPKRSPKNSPREIAQFTTNSKKKKRGRKSYFEPKEGSHNQSPGRENTTTSNKLSEIFKKNIVIHSKPPTTWKTNVSDYYAVSKFGFMKFKDLSFFEKVGFQLYSINKKLKKNNDVYDLVRLYSDFAQEKLFNKIENIFELPRAKEIFSNTLKLERWVIVILFFNLVKEFDKSTPIVSSYINKAVDLAWKNHNNLVNWIKLLNKEHQLNWILNDINRIYWDVNLEMEGLIFEIKRNQEAIAKILHRASSLFETQQRKFQLNFLENLEQWTVVKCFEKGFECFYQTFRKKGVISLNKSKETVEEEDAKNQVSVESKKEFDTPQKLKDLVHRTEEVLKTERKSIGTATPKSKSKKSYEKISREDSLDEESKNESQKMQPEFSNFNIKANGGKKKNRKRLNENLPFFLFQPDSNVQNSPRALLPPISSDKEYTLVLDLDETLVHFQEQENGKNQFLIRPYAQYFLKQMSKWYEIVIFTAALKDYADFILDRLDTHGWIKHRLYRRHTYLNGNVYQKDLSRLGRNLSRTLIVDNNAENFQLQPDNGIYIKSWYDDPEDKALFQLAPLLIEIVKKNYEDVRVAMKKLSEKMMKKLQSESYDEGKLFHLSLEPQSGFKNN